MPIKIYECEFKQCNFRDLDKKKVIIHESKCSYNPTLKMCATCGNSNYLECDYWKQIDTLYNKLLDRKHCKNWEKIKYEK